MSAVKTEARALKTLSECVICHEPIEYSAAGIRWHQICAENYDRRTKAPVLGILIILVLLGVAIGGLLFGVFGGGM